MHWPWVSRRAYEVQAEALCRAYQELDALLENNRQLLDRLQARDDPYAFWAVHLKAQQERKDAETPEPAPVGIEASL